MLPAKDPKPRTPADRTASCPVLVPPPVSLWGADGSRDGWGAGTALFPSPQGL